MSIHKTRLEHCPKCDKDVEFKIDLYYINYNGIKTCYVCPECNTVCPAYAFERFLKTGRVVIAV